MLHSSGFLRQDIEFFLVSFSFSFFFLIYRAINEFKSYFTIK